MNSSLSGEVLKDIYVELGENFRHFLAWRRFLFAGYFAVIAGLGATVSPMVEQYPELARVVPLGVVVISLVFWALDFRNRNLIRIASESGRSLEDALRLGDGGLYSAYANDGDRWLTHTSVLTVFYVVVVVASLVAVGLL